MAVITGSATGGEYLWPWGVGNTYGPDWPARHLFGGGILLALPWGILMTPAWGNIMTLGGEYFWPSTIKTVLVWVEVCILPTASYAFTNQLCGLSPKGMEGAVVVVPNGILSTLRAPSIQS